MFPFIPRSVAKGKPHNNTVKGHLPSKPVHVAPEDNPGSGTHAKKDAEIDDADLILMLEIALSDYSCWCHGELRHAMSSEIDGYLPLRYLLAESPTFSTINPRPSELELARCIRTSTGSSLEARMLLSEPSRSEWWNHGSASSASYNSQSGSFEVRRKDREVLLNSLAEGAWNKEWWDKRTIYVERIPAAYRSINSVARYIQSLLTKGGNITTSMRSAVQSIIFPPHHMARPNEPSRCKGFAFVVLESPALVDTLCRSYPWEGCSSVPDIDREAVKFGMRVLPKALWEDLKAEYLMYQRHLVSLIAGNSIVEHVNAEVENSEATSVPDDDNSSAVSVSLPTETQNFPTRYPKNCLVFVRNIHPETNKTTLRALFTEPLSSMKQAIDYIDFTKGLDSCHLRLASPSAAAELTRHFTAHPTAQCDSLDQVGSTPTEERARMELEVVTGKREDLYWERVPERVRNEAVASMHHDVDQHGHTDDGGGRRRKRRKKG